jgi:hypothetical protein
MQSLFPREVALLGKGKHEDLRRVEKRRGGRVVGLKWKGEKENEVKLGLKWEGGGREKEELEEQEGMVL